jgi:hypothetical protein
MLLESSIGGKDSHNTRAYRSPHDTHTLGFEDVVESDLLVMIAGAHIMVRVASGLESEQHDGRHAIPTGGAWSYVMISN